MRLQLCDVASCKEINTSSRAGKLHCNCKLTAASSLLSHPACFPCCRLQEVRVHADGATHLVYVLVE